MNRILKPVAFALSAAIPVLATPALSMEMTLPAACGKPDHNMPVKQPTDMAGKPMKDFQRDFMGGMQKMDPAMMQGVMQDRADVAFLCGMIAHHMGAVQMSRVELKYGKDDWTRQMAQKIIDSQTKEIGEMSRQLDKIAK
jgi:uncharacterized protein (DUF305 family)